MPVPTKSFWLPLASFLGTYYSDRFSRNANVFQALSFTYTAVVARGEGNAMDNARRRWQQQKQRGDAAMTAAGTKWLEEHKHS